MFVPFIPPFLKPPKPPGFIPPVTPFGPNPPFPEFPDNDIFSDEVVVPQDEDLYRDIPEQDEQSVPPQPPSIQKDYDVIYEDYPTPEYFNIKLTRDMFEKNKEQFLAIETESI